MKTQKVARKSVKPSASKKVVPSAKVAPAILVDTAQTMVVPMATVTVVSDIRERITPALCATVETDIAAQPADEVKIGMPIATFCKEAAHSAGVLEQYSSERADIGASFAPHKARLGGDVAPVMIFLVDELRLCEDMLAQDGGEDSAVVPNRGYVLLVEIRSACEVVVDDGVIDEKDALVAGLRKKHESRPRSHGALALALGSYANAARCLTASLSKLHGFDLALIDEAKMVSDLLLGRGIGTADGMRVVRTRRNRIVSLLRTHLKRLRKLGRYVFRHHPSIMLDLGSEFRRTRARASGDDSVDPDDMDDSEEDTPAPTPEPSDDPT